MRRQGQGADAPGAGADGGRGVLPAPRLPRCQHGADLARSGDERRAHLPLLRQQGSDHRGHRGGRPAADPRHRRRIRSHEDWAAPWSSTCRAGWSAPWRARAVRCCWKCWPRRPATRRVAVLVQQADAEVRRKIGETLRIASGHGDGLSDPEGRMRGTLGAVRRTADSRRASSRDGSRRHRPRDAARDARAAGALIAAARRGPARCRLSPPPLRCARPRSCAPVPAARRARAAVRVAAPVAAGAGSPAGGAVRVPRLFLSSISSGRSMRCRAIASPMRAQA